jgi:hypothetical protein
MIERSPGWPHIDREWRIVDPTTRWLVVLQPNQRALYEVLRQSLKADSPVSVIYDRRFRERRRGGVSARSDRRRTDRRQRRPSGWFYEAEIVRMVAERPSGGAAPGAPAASAPTLVVCAECGTELEFELPRFPQPPARLETEPIHAGLQHFVEIHAFTATGRPLLSQRNQAWRRGTAR